VVQLIFHQGVSFGHILVRVFHIVLLVKVIPLRVDSAVEVDSALFLVMVKLWVYLSNATAYVIMRYILEVSWVAVCMPLLF